MFASSFPTPKTFLRLAPDTRARPLGSFGRSCGIRRISAGKPALKALRSRARRVRDLPAARLTIESGGRRATFVRANSTLDWRDGKEDLRRRADATVKAWGGPHRRIALGCPAVSIHRSCWDYSRRNTEAEITCVTEYWEGAPEGDERAHARGGGRKWSRAQGTALRSRA